MSEPKQPEINVRGAVDLAALNRPKSPPPGTPGGAPAAGGYVVDASEATFGPLVQASAQYPILMLLWLPTDKANAAFGTELGKLAAEYGGRFLLARADVQAQPQIAAAFQVQGVPTVVALLQGQPIPLFQGAAAAAQVRAVIDQVLAAAQQAGVTGRAPSYGTPPPAAAADHAAAEAEPQLPPLHQEAYDAIERDDLDAAAAAYEKAIKQDRRDSMAVAGLAQVRLLQRTRETDLGAALAAAAAAPQDVDAALAAGDVDLLDGRIDEALARLLAVLSDADAEAKERVRLRLLDYFEIIGPGDPRVGKARQRLAIALY